MAKDIHAKTRSKSVEFEPGTSVLRNVRGLHPNAHVPGLYCHPPMLVSTRYRCALWPHAQRRRVLVASVSARQKVRPLGHVLAEQPLLSVVRVPSPQPSTSTLCSLCRHFEEIAPVRKAWVVMDTETGSKSRGFGFVECTSQVHRVFADVCYTFPPLLRGMREPWCGDTSPSVHIQVTFAPAGVTVTGVTVTGTKSQLP